MALQLAEISFSMCIERCVLERKKCAHKDGINIRSRSAVLSQLCEWDMTVAIAVALGLRKNNVVHETALSLSYSIYLAGRVSRRRCSRLVQSLATVLASSKMVQPSIRPTYSIAIEGHTTTHARCTRENANSAR